MKNIKIPEKIKVKLKKLKVGVVYLYGSQSTGTTHPMSDFDVGVVFTDHEFVKNQDSLDLHCKLYDIFSDLLPITLKKNINIQYLQKISPNKAFNIINYGEIIFETNPTFSADFLEIVMHYCADYHSLVDAYHYSAMKTFNMAK